MSGPIIRWDGITLGPVYGPTVVSNAEGQPVRAVVHVAYALSRAELLAILAESYDDPIHPDEKTVPEIREYVEEWLAGVDAIHVDTLTRHFWDDADNWPEEERERVEALERAVDRAYPQRPPTVLVSGQDKDVSVRCPVCAWAFHGGRIGPLLQAGSAHYAQEHGT